MTRKTIAIVGAGMGGLALAARLAHRGHRVVVFEKTGVVGGRNRPLRVGGSEFDAGPTLLMMLDPFFALFRDLGERLEDHLDLVLCDPSYRVFWAEGSRLDSTPNVALMVRRLERLAGPDDALAYPALLGRLAALYRDAVPNFVRVDYRSLADFASARKLALVAKHRMLANLGRQVERAVRDERLRMLLSFQTMYLGLSPFDAPWVYGVLTYMECGEGIWYPRGGMVRLAEAIAGLARARGAEIRLNAEVRAITGSRVHLADGEALEADEIVVNADLPYAERELLGEPVTTAKRRRRYSCSALMFYIDYAGRLPELLHHNVFFGSDFRGNLDDIFHRRRIPDDPAFYACVSARTDPARAPEGSDNLMLLVPCPNLEEGWTETAECRLREAVFARLRREVGFAPERIRGLRVVGPGDWRTELNLDRGAAFGLSHDFWQSAFFRPGLRSRSNPRVSFVGASTQPGNGLPMVLISAELVERRLLAEGRIS